MTMYFKFLRTGAVSLFTAERWVPTEWRTAPAVDPCRTGFHACRTTDLPYWLSDELWRVELRPPMVESVHKTVARQARLTSRVEAWDEAAKRDFGLACVARAAAHAADELTESDLLGEAEALREAAGTGASAPLVDAASEGGAEAFAKGHRQAVKLCGLVTDAVEAMEAYPVASVAYIAALAADQRSCAESEDPYAEERAGQAAWLVDRLGLHAGCG